ncbi:cyclic-di-AMP-binding protein CbpB [Alicyclobacillus sp.]|uniref:cyclic-di-AMP-binding protein CbpB n=1 Tax=Alicyclobacillus sp. TaxID=61169 RepID=UPI0025B96FE7|nr:cyclic-di-AMP-binding protein CbpB [Alicyclobacillus sp.]MCL6517105.1 CBS domain-containing protein [Alicyclobacillus sp.]
MATVDVSQFLSQPAESLMIAADNVACVHVDHTLEHALLVLTHSGYSAIPVLDGRGTVRGLIHTNLVINTVARLDGYAMDTLSERTVGAVMNDRVPTLKRSEPLLRALELAINHPFICVVEEDERLAGLITRKALLGKLYQFVRERGGR